MENCPDCLGWALGFLAVTFVSLIMTIVEGRDYRKLRDERDKLQVENMILKSKEVQTNDTK